MDFSSDLTKIIEFLKVVRPLQTTYRNTPMPDTGFESDAEHSWSVALICMLLADRLESEFDIKLDQLKMLKMALIHDIAEIKTGDTKTWDTQARINKEENEREAIKTLTAELPGDLENELKTLWEECEARETIEAKIVKSIDRFDPVLHRLVFDIGWKGVVEDEHATVGALNARQLSRHEFSKVLLETYSKIRDEAVQKKLFLN